jgi:hypothetical protein
MPEAEDGDFHGQKRIAESEKRKLKPYTGLRQQTEKSGNGNKTTAPPVARRVKFPLSSFRFPLLFSGFIDPLVLPEPF